MTTTPNLIAAQHAARACAAATRAEALRHPAAPLVRAQAQRAADLADAAARAIYHSAARDDANSCARLADQCEDLADLLTRTA